MCKAVFAKYDWRFDAISSEGHDEHPIRTVIVAQLKDDKHDDQRKPSEDKFNRVKKIPSPLCFSFLTLIIYKFYVLPDNLRQDNFQEW